MMKRVDYPRRSVAANKTARERLAARNSAAVKARSQRRAAIKAAPVAPAKS